ncbi:uncharacterized protein LOC114277998 [Camellia sinensis]|uniref:uncharacterized protein LOC114277998 n=1 Tax=Camellia sinensis TaxID=4442 RepID=UPI0010355F50|nr:uncharacterized protein LOC114277998 [Camellia sinensis]
MANMLIDTDASHSLISTAFASALGLEMERLASPFRVESPVGGIVDLDRGCRGFEIEVARLQLPFAFVLLDMLSFDVILGMDRLSSYRAMIDCFRQRVTVCTSSGDCFYFLGDQVNRVLSPVFDPCSRNELNGLLATLLDSEGDGTRVELPRVVCEYPDVFSEDLTSLPPHREIEFTINLVPRTTTISMASYRFSPAESHELKTQLQELLDKAIQLSGLLALPKVMYKGFIRSNRFEVGVPTIESPGGGHPESGLSYA